MNNIYYLNLAQLYNPEIYTKALKSLSDERKRKANSIKHPSGKCRSVGAGYLIATGLKDAGLDPLTERVCLSSKGKPFLPDHPDVHFNVSHSGKYVVCAFADRTVGIDIEEIHEIKPELIKYALDKKEIAEYEDTPAEKQIRRFFELWTKKEAFLKHIARGLSVRPADINSQFADKIARLNFYVWHDIPGYVLTLCSDLDRPILTEVVL
jgi:4'-phosphopantetheinyl transferase